MPKFNFIREDLGIEQNSKDRFYFIIGAQKPDGVDGFSSMPDRMFYNCTKENTFDLLLTPKASSTVKNLEQTTRLYPRTTHFEAVAVTLIRRFVSQLPRQMHNWHYCLLLKKASPTLDAAVALPDKITYI